MLSTCPIISNKNIRQGITKYFQCNLSPSPALWQQSPASLRGSHTSSATKFEGSALEHDKLRSTIQETKMINWCKNHDKQVPSLSEPFSCTYGCANNTTSIKAEYMSMFPSKQKSEAGQTLLLLLPLFATSRCCNLAMGVRVFITCIASFASGRLVNQRQDSFRIRLVE